MMCKVSVVYLSWKLSVFFYHVRYWLLHVFEFKLMLVSNIQDFYFGFHSQSARHLEILYIDNIVYICIIIYVVSNVLCLLINYTLHHFLQKINEIKTCTINIIWLFCIWKKIKKLSYIPLVFSLIVKITKYIGKIKRIIPWKQFTKLHVHITDFLKYLVITS